MTLLNKAHFICLDCEFTGLDLEKDRIIEVAAVRFTFSEILDEFDYLVKPDCQISEEAFAIHHISAEMVANKPPIEAILPTLLAFVRRDLIVGHAIESDLNMLTCAAKRANIPCIVGVSVGVGDDEKKRAEALYIEGARLFCVDVAHAHGKLVGKMIKHMKQEYSDSYIIAGNVATYAGSDYLVSVGADAVKVGIGAGSVCTTRQVTGFGVPQFTAIMECARIDKPIIADGGIRTSGDAVKALAAGATMVMLGGMLAGTDEACGYLGTYRGMASAEARKDYFGETSEGRATEGVSISVKPKGPVARVIKEIVGGIKSGFSYAGARNLQEMQRKVRFMEVTQAVAKENTPHALG